MMPDIIEISERLDAEDARRADRDRLVDAATEIIEETKAPTQPRRLRMNASDRARLDVLDAWARSMGATIQETHTFTVTADRLQTKPLHSLDEVEEALRVITQGRSA